MRLQDQMRRMRHSPLGEQTARSLPTAVGLNHASSFIEGAMRPYNIFGWAALA